MMGAKKTGVKETGRREMGGKATGGREKGGKESGAKGTMASGVKATGAQDSQKMGRKGDMLISEREMDNMLPGDTTAGQNATEGIQRKSYSEVVIEGVKRRVRVFVGDLIVRKTNRALSKLDDVVVCLLGTKIEAITERVGKKDLF